MAIPERLPLEFSDKLNAASAIVYVPEIHWVADFDGPMDRDRLKRALRLLLDAEPVLGCRLVERPFAPYWKRLSSEDLGADILLLKSSGDESEMEASAQSFLDEFPDWRTGPQIRALLLRGKSGDRLIIKINHLTCDAGGFKEALYTLAGIARRLAEDPCFVPEPRVGSRSLSQVYGRFSLLSRIRIFFQGLREIGRMMWPFRSLQYPSGKKQEGPLRYVFHRFEKERSREITQYAGSHGATVNDMFVTAIIRAMAKQTDWRGKTALRLVGTVDLRRFLPGRRAGALCQVTGMYSVHLGKLLEDCFEDTLARVRETMDKKKSRFFGLGMFSVMGALYGPYPYLLFKPAMGSFWRMGLWDGNLPTGFTNLGTLDKAALDFSGPGLTGAFLTIPATRPPWIGLGLSGFDGELTLSAGAWPSAVSPDKLRKLFSLVDRGLPGG